jgi:plastocyanin
MVRRFRQREQAMLNRRSFVAALGAAPLSACGAFGPAHRAERQAGVAAVEMSGFSFAPAEIQIRVGETVEWRNVSFFTHTVTCDRSKAADPAHIALPQGASPFDSGRIPAGELWRRTFTAPGTYRYVCLPHEDEGMLGTVIVRA